MAATATNRGQVPHPVNVGVEFFDVDMDTDTTVTITPTQIKSIQHVSVTPLDAAGCAAGVPFLSSFTRGGTSFELTGIASSLYLVKVEGFIA